MWREEAGGGGGKGKGEKWQRHWCVLDGSTLLCYTDEEVSQGGLHHILHMISILNFCHYIIPQFHLLASK